MATSGTTAFTLDMGELVEEAFERNGSEMLTGYDMRTARRSLNLLFADWANRGVNLWTLDSGTVPLLDGVATYTLPTDTVDLMDCVIRTDPGVVATQTDLPITRISSSTYASIPNKLSQGRPIQMLVTRGTAGPTVTVWPVPDGDDYTFVYWRLRRIQDVGSNAAVTNDVPFRMLPALASGLAYYLSFKLPKGLERNQMLQAAYDADWQRASDEDREKATMRITPGIGRV